MREKLNSQVEFTPSERYLCRNFGFRKQLVTRHLKDGTTITKTRYGNQIGDFLSTNTPAQINGFLCGNRKLSIRR